MVTTLSTGFMTALGFRELAENQEICASFLSVAVYQIFGMELERGAGEPASGLVSGIPYRLAIGTSVNDGCLALCGDAFCENEDAWKDEYKCAGPFLLVQLGPTREYICKNGRAKLEDDGSTTTYDCFPEARNELEALQAKALPSIETATACVLSNDSHPVRLRRITTAIAGRDTTNSVIHDTRITVRAEMSSSYRLDLPRLAQKLEITTRLASTINPKASRFFALGLSERDELKKFLYLFLAIEIATHATFTKINHPTSVANILKEQRSQKNPAAALVLAQIEGLKGLFDRFSWCVACNWNHLEESDIQRFKELISARNDIAHGSSATPPPGYANSAEILARKILYREIGTPTNR
jgi:hypothetical protein